MGRTHHQRRGCTVHAFRRRNPFNEAGSRVTAFAQLGYPIGLAPVLGIIGLVCVALYAIPRTSILGAIVLTGYLGGAVASHLRVGGSLFGEVLFPVYFGVLVWGGLFLRDERLRTLIPLRS